MVLFQTVFPVSPKLFSGLGLWGQAVSHQFNIQLFASVLSWDKQYQRYNIQTITELSSYLYLLSIHLSLSLIQWVFLFKLPLVFIPFTFLMAGRSQELYFKACYPCCKALSTGKSCTKNTVWFQKSYNWGLQIHQLKKEAYGLILSTYAQFFCRFLSNK